jgi:hypothetical protein
MHDCVCVWGGGALNARCNMNPRRRGSEAAARPPSGVPASGEGGNLQEGVDPAAAAAAAVGVARTGVRRGGREGRRRAGLARWVEPGRFESERACVRLGGFECVPAGAGQHPPEALLEKWSWRVAEV